jgi:hypothetical protein
MNLTSIYGYIEQRLGVISYKTAATIFLISRTIGSAFRLYLVVIVLQRYVFDFNFLLQLRSNFSQLILPILIVVD